MSDSQKGEQSRERLKKLALERAQQMATSQAQRVAEHNPADPRQEVANQNLVAKQYLSSRSGVEQPFFIFVRSVSGREYVMQMMHKRARGLSTPEEKAKLIAELLASKIVGHIPSDAIEYIGIAQTQEEANKYATADILK